MKPWERTTQELEKKVAQRTAALQREKEQAESATANKDRFVALVSHDLRSPIGGIKMMIQSVIEDDAEMDEKYRKDTIAGIAGMTDRLLSMIDELLDVTRLQSGKVEVRKQHVYAHHLVRDNIENLEGIARNKDIFFDNMTDKEFRFFVDQTLFGEVIGNILSNSLKFCSKGDTITITAQKGDMNIIKITDTGPGVREGIIDDLFRNDIHTSNPGSEGEKGTGLGLPYCYDIMQAHGGDITCESKEGRGTTFTITIPVE